MKIFVSPLAKVGEIMAARRPSHVVSVLDPGFAFPDLGPAYEGRHLRLCVHDVHTASPGQVAPSADHVEKLLGFLAEWNRVEPLLVHCRAGIGRSPAVAYIAACFHKSMVDERTIMDGLRDASPHARPNESLIGFADDAMGRNGRMVRAVVDTGRGLGWLDVAENLPFQMPE